MRRFIVILVWLCCVFYAVGDYFVDFALKRGDDLSPPKACADIADPNLKVPPAPNFSEENWTMDSFDGLKLYAKRFFPTEETNRWAILVHGYGRDGTYAYDYADEYLKHGWNVLIPDLRASGKSDGKFITMGALESRDLFDWATKISADNPDAKIILHGVSMGAATVLMTAALEPKNLYAVVEDCGYTSAYEMFTAQLNKIFGLPEYPVMPCADIVCKFKTSVKISDAAPIDSVDKIKVPILFIHGDKDGLVPLNMVDKLFDKATAPKEKFVVAGAGHADSKRKDPNTYFNKVFEFLEGVL